MPPPAGTPGGAGAVVAAVFTGLWLVTLAVLPQYGVWLAAQIGAVSGLALPPMTWVVVAAASLLLGAPPALLLALVPRSPAVRAVGRAFTIGVGAMAVGSLLRLVPFRQHELYLLALAGLAGLAAVVLRRGSGSSGAPGAIGWAVAGGALIWAPFAWLAGLGGPLETVMAALAALGVGALAAVMLDSGYWRPFQERGRAWLVLLGGSAAGTALTPLAAAVGANGTQLLSLVVLPPLGFAVAALAPATARGGTPALLLALAAFGPLGFVDPEEINFFLADRDVPFWASVATLLAWSVAALLGLGYGLGLLRRTPDPAAPGRVLPRLGGRPIAATAAAVATAGAGVLYAVAGQPGFYGDQLFVVLKEQAPLTGLPTTTGLGPGRDERVRAVYRHLVRHADSTQAALRRELDRWHLNYRPYYLVNGLLVRGGPAVRAWLESRDEVDRVLLDQRLRPLPATAQITRGTSSTPPATPPWNIDMVGAPELWRRSMTGSGIVVGGADSGVDGSHPAMAGTFRGGDDSWFDPWNGSDRPVDHNGHGTHTLATAVGGQGVGVAPGALWIACVNLDRNMGSPSYYLDCMQFMLAPFPNGGDPLRDGRPERAPHVLTNSWACPPLEGCDLTVLSPAGRALAAAGIAFVAAAGNTGPACGSIDTPPGTDSTSITVAAVDEGSEAAAFSSRGGPGSGKPDLAAPGQGVLSAMPGGTYERLDGTSMATPHVAGVIALLWSARPELVGDLARTRELLARGAVAARTADQTCPTVQQVGSGIVNAAGSLRAAQQ